MSQCLLDFGNSRYKWLLNTELESPAALRSGEYCEQPEDTINTIVDALVAIDGLEAIVVSSVKGQAFDSALIACCESVLKLTPVLIRTGCVTSFQSAYHQQQLFGVDRYVALLGAIERYRVPAIIVDAGTAVTFDALDRESQHLGGCIYPGMTLLSRSLLRNTARILNVAEDQGALFGRSTAEGAAGGVQCGFVSAVRGIIETMQLSFAEPATIILTGGDAQLLATALEQETIVDPLLVFRGIAKAYRLTS